MVIQLIVEGHGEVTAAETLTRRILVSLEVRHFKLNTPIRINRSDFLNREIMAGYISLARRRSADRILAIYDADDDCPVELNRTTRAIFADECPDILAEAVVAVKEYEAWLLAGASGLAGQFGISATPLILEDPEAPRNAKKAITDLLPYGRSYKPAADQDKLTRKFSLDEAKRSRSFRALLSAVDRLAKGTSSVE